MKLLKLVRIGVVVSALGLGACVTRAQDPDRIKQLKLQLEQMQANFDRVVREQQAQIEELKKQIAAMQPAASNNAAVAAVPAPPPTSSSPPAATEVLTKPWSPTSPIRIGRGSAYADLGLVGTFAVGGSTASDIEGGTELGGHDPNQNGFTVQGVEMNLQGAVDPYFRGNANIVFSLDSGGESFVELEEAWLETISLPANLQVRAGQYLSEFGRINTQHPHQWAFVDTPLVNGRYLGPDGLGNPGVRLSWLVPTPFYSEIFFGVQNSQGETAYSFRNGGNHHHGDGEEDEPPFAYRQADNDRGVTSVGDLLFTPRYAMSFDLTDTQTLLAGVSAAFGPNSSGEAGDTVTQIYGVDLYWKWKSPTANAGFPFVSFQAEGMLRRYDAGVFDWQEVADAGGVPIIDEDTGLPAVLSREKLTDYGFYAELLYGFRKAWVAGLRLDYVTEDVANYEKRALSYEGEQLGRDPSRDERWRLAPNLTWYPSEYSKLRLQYNYDNRRDIGVDHSVWLQFEFLLGAHAAHKF